MNSFKKRVMRRVYAVWLFRKTLPIFLIELPLFILFLIKVREMVFWAKVLANARIAAANISSLVQFVTFTLTTRLAADAIIIAISLVTVFMIRDLFAASRGIALFLKSEN